MSALRLDQLSLKNFRCFPQCEIQFHPDLTVLVADNGSGKTAVLDAAAVALSVFVKSLYSVEPLKRLDRGDVRLALNELGHMLPCLPMGFEAAGDVGDVPVSWKSVVGSYGNRLRQSTVHFRALQSAAKAFLSDSAVLPLVAYYGTGRLWSEYRLTGYRRTSVTNVEERVTGYADALTSASSIKGLSAWHAARVSQLASPLYRESLTANLAMLQGVRESADKVLQPTGWSDMQWDSKAQVLTAYHETRGRLPLFMLSDGVRTMLALVADVARRCASLNPHLREQASLLTPGILLIDEVDMHLHPHWQQHVLERLRDAFPKLQIIVSTHSPHVLSTVDKSSIRILHVDGEARIETPMIQTRGDESADVLANVMHVDPIPPLPESRDVRTYRALIEDGRADSQEALGLRQRLVAHFGAGHRVMLDCDRLIRFQAFRARKREPGGP